MNELVRLVAAQRERREQRPRGRGQECAGVQVFDRGQYPAQAYTEGDLPD